MILTSILRLREAASKVEKERIDSRIIFLC